MYFINPGRHKHGHKRQAIITTMSTLLYLKDTNIWHTRLISLFAKRHDLANGTKQNMFEWITKKKK